MQDLKDKLTVLHTTDGVSFQNHSADALDLLRGGFSVSNTIYIGFKKPVGSLFVAVPTSNTNTGAWTASYYTTTWTALDAHFDSSDFSQSGFIRWLEPEGEAQTTVNGSTLYWYRLQHSSGSTASITGIGPLLCSSRDIEELDFNVDEDAATQLKAMVSARNIITKEMQVSAWDLLNVQDVSEAAAFYSLHLLYTNRSDRPDDHYAVVAQGYLDDYRSLKAKIATSIDRNDNGKLDEGERQTSRTVYFER
jgi:hypothetical protein